RRLAFEMLSEIVEHLPDLFVGGGHAKIDHLRHFAFPALARQTHGCGALRLVTLAAEPLGDFPARTIGKLLRDGRRGDGDDEDSCPDPRHLLLDLEAKRIESTVVAGNVDVARSAR